MCVHHSALRRSAFSALGALLAVACGTAQAPDRAAGADAAESTRAAADPTPRAPSSSRPRIVCLGDSLTAGYGLDDAARQSYPALLQRKLDAAGYDLEVINAGVSGDTSAGGLRRLDWSLDGDVRVLVVALGANDGLRGLSVDELKRNLDTLVRRAQQRRIRVLLAGMEVPPNLGQDYANAFRRVFRDVARERDVALLPFLLAGVGGDPQLNQRDGIHPNATGTQMVAENVWQALRPLLASHGHGATQPRSTQRRSSAATRSGDVRPVIRAGRSWSVGALDTAADTR